MDCDVSTLLDAIQSGDADQQMQALASCSDSVFDPTLWYWLIGFTIVCAVVGALIGKYKNAVVRDTVLGLALGPIGWLISLLLPKRAKNASGPPYCGSCGKSVIAGDKYCRHCGALIAAASPVNSSQGQ
jgi:hypothetical protein